MIITRCRKLISKFGVWTSVSVYNVREGGSFNMSYNSVFLEEIEVLQAIYEDELNVSVSNQSYAEMNITIHPNTADDEEGKYVCLTLNFQFAFSSKSVHCYPNKEPIMFIKNPRGLSDSHLASIEENLKFLAKSMTGEQMMFSLIEYAKESLTDNNHPSCCCSICLENFVEGGNFFRTGCYHYFHRKCIKSYVTISENMICPVCRLEFEIDESIMQFDDLPEKSNDHEEFVPDSKFMAWRQRCNEIYEKQKRKGGIIDLEFEKNKYLITANDTPADNSAIVTSEFNDIEVNSSVSRKFCSSPKGNRGHSPIAKVDRKCKPEWENGKNTYYSKKSDQHFNERKFRTFHDVSSPSTSAYSEHCEVPDERENLSKTGPKHTSRRNNDSYHDGKQSERKKIHHQDSRNEKIRSQRKDDGFHENVPRNGKNYRHNGRKIFEGENKNLKNPHSHNHQNIDKYGTRGDQKINRPQRRRNNKDNGQGKSSDIESDKMEASVKNEVVESGIEVPNVLDASENHSDSIADTNVLTTNDNIKMKYNRKPDKKTEGRTQNPNYYTDKTGGVPPNQRLCNASYVTNDGDSKRTDASTSKVDSVDKINTELRHSLDTLSDLMKDKLITKSVPPGFEILDKNENLGSEILSEKYESDEICKSNTSIPPGFNSKFSNASSVICKKSSRVPPGFTAQSSMECSTNDAIVKNEKSSWQGSCRNRNSDKTVDCSELNRHNNKRTPKSKSCMETS